MVPQCSRCEQILMLVLVVSTDNLQVYCQVFGLALLGIERLINDKSQ